MAHFEGQVRTQWLRHRGPDRKMRLLEDFVFVDDQNVRWEAPAGSIIDGASIPEGLWSIAGTPYVGDYRRGSVVHDVACQQQARPHEDVHRMFYDAIVTDGVPQAQALKMYVAVRLFGPRWTVTPPGALVAPGAAMAPPRELTIDEVEAALDAVLGE